MGPSCPLRKSCVVPTSKSSLLGHVINRSSLFKDGHDKDGHGLKVEKLGPTFSIFNLMTAEMSLWFVLPADEIGLIHVSSS